MNDRNTTPMSLAQKILTGAIWAIILATLFGLGLIAHGQQTLAPFFTSQENTNIYVKMGSGSPYATIHLATVKACTSPANFTVIILPGANPTDSIGGQAGVCNGVVLIDYTAAPATTYKGNGTVYVAQGGGGGCTGPCVTTFNGRNGPVTLSAPDVQSALAAQTGCATVGYLYSPQSNACLAPAAGGVSSFNTRTGAVALSAPDVQSALTGLTGCSTVGNAYNPQTNTCLPQSGGSGAVGPAGSVQIQGPTPGTPVASDNTTLLNGLTVQEYTNTQHPPLAYWDAALHNCRNQVVKILILADSRSIVDKTVTPGAGTLGVDFNQRWARQLENYLQSPSICGSAGQGIVPFRWGTGNFSTQGFNADYYTVTAGYTATDIALGPYQPGSSDPMTVTGTSTSTPINFSPPQPYDHLQMIARVGAGLSPWTLKIDSSVVGTCGGAGSTSAVLCTSSAVTLGSHTASATCPSGTCEGYGLGTTAGTSGVQVINAAVGGASAEVQGQFPATQFAYSDLITPQALTIIYHVTNEPGQGISPTQFNTTLGNIITHQQALSPPPSILMFSPMLDNDFPVAQQDFYPFLLSNSRAFQTAYTDLRNRWSPPPTVAPAFLFGSDYVHENNIGNGEVYSAIAATLIDVPPTVPVVTPALYATQFVCVNTKGKFVSQPTACADINPDACGIGFAHAYSITIPGGSVTGGAPLMNYPVTLPFNGASTANSITLANLKTVGNGGQLQSSSGIDVQFCTSSTPGAGTTIPYELEAGTYVPTSGAGVWDVLISNLSNTTSNVIYMFVGKAGATDTSNSAGTWTPGGYSFVAHLGGNSSISLVDSTGNGNTLTNVGAAATVGQLGGGVVVTGSSQYLQGLATGTPTGNGERTVEAWVKVATPPSNGILFGYGATSGDGGYSMHYYSGPTTQFYTTPTGDLMNDLTWIPDANFHQYTGVLPTGTATAADQLIYIDGAPRTLVCGSVCTQPFATVAGNVQINGLPGTAGSVGTAETVDEFRIANLGRTAGWIATEYSNMTNAAGFLSVATIF